MARITNSLSDYFANIEFFKPEALWLFLLVIPISALLYVSYRKDFRFLNLLKAPSGKLWKEYLILSLAFLFLLSGTIGILAQPNLQVYSDSERKIQGDYIFLVDVSRSTDARPSPTADSQLDLSRQFIREILSTLEGSRVQIFAYTSAAFPLSDFTVNLKQIEDTLDHIIAPEVIQERGSNLPNALAVIARHKMEDERYKDVTNVMLISDGQISAKYARHLNTSIEMLKDQDIILTTVGVGSITGWRIPLFDKDTGKFTGEYAQERGRPYRDFTSVLNERNLEILAGQTSGGYFHYEQANLLKEYLINNAEQSSVRTYQSDRELLENKDVAWIFTPLLAIGIMILVLRRNLV